MLHIGRPEKKREKKIYERCEITVYFWVLLISYYLWGLVLLVVIMYGQLFGHGFLQSLKFLFYFENKNSNQHFSEKYTSLSCVFKLGAQTIVVYEILTTTICYLFLVSFNSGGLVISILRRFFSYFFVQLVADFIEIRYKERERERVRNKRNVKGEN